MLTDRNIRYNPSLTVAENAKNNGVSVAAIRMYIKNNSIDRRFDRKRNVIADCRKYLKKHPKATWEELHKKTGHSLSTMRKYREFITTDKELIDFDNKKAKKRQEISERKKQELIAFLDTIPVELLKGYIKTREEKPLQIETVEGKSKEEEVTILNGIPFKPYEEFHIPVKDCIQFHSKALPENKVLSNHYECIITFRGYEFYGLEQLYAALTYSDSPNILKQIMNCTSGKAAKSLCKIKYDDKRDWDFEEKRYRIIALCHLYKYLSVKEFRDRLRETYPQTLVECPNGKDYLFGMVQNLETNVFEGNNCSGRTLMAVRDMMKEKEDYEIGYNEALLEREFSEAEKEEVREALYGDIRCEFDDNKQVIKDSKPLISFLEREKISKTRDKHLKPFKAPVIDRETKCLVMDFDDTLFDTSADDEYRKGKEKDMEKAMTLIPEYKLYEGWKAVFDWTTKNGVKIAILSAASSKLIEKAVQHFNIPCSAIIGYQPYIEKPNTILGNMLQEKLNIRHEQIIYVGNSDKDEIQARASQFRFVGATWFANHKDYFIDKGVQTVSNPKELIPIMEEMGWKKAGQIDDGIVEIRYKERTNPRSSKYYGLVRCTKDFAYFYQGVPFSNWWTSPAIEYDGHTFFSSESIFMYRKAKLFKDTETAEKIAKSTYREAKALGRSIKNFDEDKMKEVREPLMYIALQEKLKYDTEFRNALLSDTYKGKVFVEASKEDMIWGIGAEATDDVLEKGVEGWKGMNLLGKVLTNLRDTVLHTKTVIPSIEKDEAKKKRTKNK